MKIQYLLSLLPAFICFIFIVGCTNNNKSNVDLTYDVVITEVIDGRKINAIKGVREVTGLGLKKAKDIVDSMPSIVKEDISKTEAEKISLKLTESSLEVEVRIH